MDRELVLTKLSNGFSFIKCNWESESLMAICDGVPVDFLSFNLMLTYYGGGIMYAKNNDCTKRIESFWKAVGYTHPDTKELTLYGAYHCALMRVLRSAQLTVDYEAKHMVAAMNSATDIKPVLGDMLVAMKQA